MTEAADDNADGSVGAVDHFKGVTSKQGGGASSVHVNNGMEIGCVEASYRCQQHWSTRHMCGAGSEASKGLLLG